MSLPLRCQQQHDCSKAAVAGRISHFVAEAIPTVAATSWCGTAHMGKHCNKGIDAYRATCANKLDKQTQI
jgi:hypothetical protein